MPVIILTAREEEADKVLGLEIGADDYITKPFSMRELMARVKANIRRTAMQQPPEDAVPAAGGLTIDPENYQVSKHGKPIALTQREYELLTFLAGEGWGTISWDSNSQRTKARRRKRLRASICYTITLKEALARQPRKNS